QIVAVGEGQALLERHGEDGVAGELGGLGEIRFGPAVLGADRGVQQVGVALRPHGRGAVVVGGGRVQGGDLVGGADGDGAAAPPSPLPEPPEPSPSSVVLAQAVSSTGTPAID